MNRTGIKGVQESIARTYSIRDVWQAASLLVGLFGSEASEYAANKTTRCLATHDLAGAATWSLIESQIDLLLTGEIDRQMS